MSLQFKVISYHGVSESHAQEQQYSNGCMSDNGNQFMDEMRVEQ